MLTPSRRPASAITDGLSKMIEETRSTDEDPDDEPPGARVPAKPKGT